MVPHEAAEPLSGLAWMQQAAPVAFQGQTVALDPFNLDTSASGPAGSQERPSVSRESSGPDPYTSGHPFCVSPCRLILLESLAGHGRLSY